MEICGRRRKHQTRNMATFAVGQLLLPLKETENHQRQHFFFNPAITDFVDVSGIYQPANDVHL